MMRKTQRPFIPPLPAHSSKVCTWRLHFILLVAFIKPLLRLPNKGCLTRRLSGVPQDIRHLVLDLSCCVLQLVQAPLSRLGLGQCRDLHSQGRVCRGVQFRHEQRPIMAGRMLVMARADGYILSRMLDGVQFRHEQRLIMAGWRLIMASADGYILGRMLRRV